MDERARGSHSDASSGCNRSEGIAANVIVNGQLVPSSIWCRRKARAARATCAPDLFSVQGREWVCASIPMRSRPLEGANRKILSLALGRNPIYRFRKASRQADKSNRGRRNIAAASPMASGVGPIKSQNRGWSALAAAIVPDNRSVRVKLKELMSFPDQSDSFADRSVFRRSLRTLHWRSRDSDGRSVALFG